MDWDLGHWEGNLVSILKALHLPFLNQNEVLKINKGTIDGSQKGSGVLPGCTIMPIHDDLFTVVPRYVLRVKVRRCGLATNWHHMMHTSAGFRTLASNMSQLIAHITSFCLLLSSQQVYIILEES